MELQAQKRDIVGKKVNGLRKDGLIPAELYGHGKENVHLSVPAKEFTKVFKEAGESSLVTLRIDDHEVPVLVHDVQTDPIEDIALHIDFYAVRMDEKLRASIPVRFVGEAPAVKEYGGILVKAVHELTVEAFPADLPRELEVDVMKLMEIGNSIHVSDILVDASKVKLLADGKTTVVTVVEAKEEEAPVLTAEEAAAAAAGPAVAEEKAETPAEEQTKKE